MGTSFWLMDKAGKRALSVGKYGSSISDFTDLDHADGGGWIVTAQDLTPEWGAEWLREVGAWMSKAAGPVVMISEHWETMDMVHPWESWDDGVQPGWPVESPVAVVVMQPAEHPLSVALGPGWRWLRDPIRAVVSIHHESGLFFEASCECIDERDSHSALWVAIATAADETAATGATGLHIAEVTREAERAFSVRLVPANSNPQGD